MKADCQGVGREGGRWGGRGREGVRREKEEGEKRIEQRLR